MLVRFWNNFTEMFFKWPFSEIFKALVNRGYFYYTDMNYFLKSILLWNHWSDFEITS